MNILKDIDRLQINHNMLIIDLNRNKSIAYTYFMKDNYIYYFNFKDNMFVKYPENSNKYHITDVFIKVNLAITDVSEEEAISFLQNYNSNLIFL